MKPIKQVELSRIYDAPLDAVWSAWTEGQKDETQIDQTTEVTFIAQGAKTRVDVKAAIYKLGPKAGMAAEGMQYGFTQQQEKLAAYLAGKQS